MQEGQAASQEQPGKSLALTFPWHSSPEAGNSGLSFNGPCGHGYRGGGTIKCDQKK